MELLVILLVLASAIVGYSIGRKDERLIHEMVEEKVKQQ